MIVSFTEFVRVMDEAQRSKATQTEDTPDAPIQRLNGGAESADSRSKVLEKRNKPNGNVREDVSDRQWKLF